MIPRLKALARRSLKPLALRARSFLLRARSFLDAQAGHRDQLILDAIADLKAELAATTDELELTHGSTEALRAEVAELRRQLDQRLQPEPSPVARLAPQAMKADELEGRAARAVSRIKPRG